jgi:hypothetical protein
MPKTGNNNNTVTHANDFNGLRFSEIIIAMIDIVVTVEIITRLQYIQEAILYVITASMLNLRPCYHEQVFQIAKIHQYLYILNHSPLYLTIYNTQLFMAGAYNDTALTTLQSLALWLY